MGSSQNNIDEINVSRTGLTYNANIESLINYDSSDGKTESDYIQLQHNNRSGVGSSQNGPI